MKIKSKLEEVVGQIEVQMNTKKEITEIRRIGDKSRNKVRPIFWSNPKAGIRKWKVKRNKNIY